MTTRIIKLSSAGIAAALLLGACTSAGAESPPTSSTAATSSTAPTPTTAATSSSPAGSPTTSQGPVEVPKAATQRTEAGAKAFIAHFIGTFNEVALKPRTGVMSALGTANCKTCAKFEEEQVYLAKYEQHYVSPPARLESVNAQPGTSPTAAHYGFAVGITSFGVGIADKTGKVLRHDTAVRGTYAIYLVWTTGGWRVDAMKKIA